MQHYAIVFSPRAEHQLANLYTFIAERSGENLAEKYVGEIVADCRSLTIFLERGARRDDIRPGLRVKGYARRVTIAFSIDNANKKVAVHGVFYGGQDFETVLRGAPIDV
jgi:toxin ParE1/3/4